MPSPPSSWRTTFPGSSQTVWSPTPSFHLYFPFVVSFSLLSQSRLFYFTRARGTSLPDSLSLLVRRLRERCGTSSGFPPCDSLCSVSFLVSTTSRERYLTGLFRVNVSLRLLTNDPSLPSAGVDSCSPETSHYLYQKLDLDLYPS